MHRRVRDKLEDILAGTAVTDGRHQHDSHLDGCAECRDAVAAMREHHRLLRSLRLLTNSLSRRAQQHQRYAERSLQIIQSHVSPFQTLTLITSFRRSQISHSDPQLHPSWE